MNWRDCYMNGKKILIVDDDASFLKILKEQFTNKGWKVEIATNGGTALEKFALFMPDVVTMDILMPILNGFNAVQLIRKHVKGHPYLLFFLTCLQDEKYIAKGLENYMAVDYIEKENALENIKYISWKIEKRYKMLFDFHNREKVWIPLGQLDINALISFKIVQGFSGTIHIKCENSEYTLKLENGEPKYMKKGGKDVLDMDLFLREITMQKACRLKIMSEDEIQNMLRGRIKLALESLNLFIGQPDKLAIIDAKRQHFISLNDEMETLKQALIFLTKVSFSVLSKLKLVGYREADHMIFRTSDYAILFVPVDDSRFIVSMFNPDVFDKMKARYIYFVKNKTDTFRKILSEEAMSS